MYLEISAYVMHYLFNYKIIDNRVGFPKSAYDRVINKLEELNINYVDSVNNKNKDLAELYANEFLDKYKDKSSIIKHAKVYIDEIMPLFDLPINIRKYVYTNNIVESVNSKIQRGFYGRGALPNAESAINIIYVNLIDLEKKWNKSKVTNWDKIFSEIQIVHKNIIDEYLK